MYMQNKPTHLHFRWAERNNTSRLESRERNTIALSSGLMNQNTFIYLTVYQTDGTQRAPLTHCRQRLLLTDGDLHQEPRCAEIETPECSSRHWMSWSHLPPPPNGFWILREDKAWVVDDFKETMFSGHQREDEIRTHRMLQCASPAQAQARQKSSIWAVCGGQSLTLSVGAISIWELLEERQSAFFNDISLAGSTTLQDRPHSQE